MKKKYHSQEKYEENNPCITFRMKKEEKEKINILAKKSGKSISELVRMALLGLQKDFSIAYNNGFEKGKESGNSIGYKKGYDDGYNKGRNDWAIWITCYRCTEGLYIKPNTFEHTRLISETRGIFCHTKCPKDSQ